MGLSPSVSYLTYTRSKLATPQGSYPLMKPHETQLHPGQGGSLANDCAWCYGNSIIMKTQGGAGKEKQYKRLGLVYLFSKGKFSCHLRSYAKWLLLPQSPQEGSERCWSIWKEGWAGHTRAACLLLLLEEKPFQVNTAPFLTVACLR